MRTNVHAGLVRVGRAGILVEGPSGSGKSSLLVSLVRAAAREGLDAALVADDRVELERRGSVLVGRAPQAIAGLIELRGAGIVRLPAATEAEVTLCAVLADDPVRLPEDAFEVLGLALPRVELPVRQAPFCADILLTLVLAGPGALAKL